MGSTAELFENGDMTRTTVHVPVDALNEFRARGLNFSLFIRRCMMAMLGDYFDDIEVFLKREILIDEKNRTEEKLYNLNKQIIQLNKRKESIDVQIRRLDLQHVAAQRATDISQCTLTLNKVISGCNFDSRLVQSSAPDILEQMIELNPDFNLDNHINRMKEILDF